MLNAEFIQGQHGRWLLTQWRAPTPGADALLILPPFAEEMNCVRRHFAALGRALAASGIDVFLMDYYGTGDSDGDFFNSSLALWQQDCMQWLSTLMNYHHLHLLGCRFSAAILLDWLPGILQQLESQQIAPGKVLLWQPLLQMDRFWQQLKRQQMLVAQVGSDEVAGYRLPPGLERECAALQPDLAHSQELPLLWLESQLNGKLSLASARLLSAHQTVRHQVLPVAPYWLEQEVLDCSPLISASYHFLTERPDVA